MASSRGGLYWQLGWASWLAMSGAIAWGNSALAQVMPDNSLGIESSQVTSPSPGAFQIDGGATRGANLFHSFAQFSVPTGGEAYFRNASSIQNIISRVTGGVESNIDGLLRANGTANLFLLNPNGIIFGKDASLNIGGSFVATTANAIQFSGLGIFSASNPKSPALLTVNPSALLFNQIAAAPIQNNSVSLAGLDPSGLNSFGLRVPDGQSLLLVGGDISIDGGGLNAFGGRVELGGLAGAGTVGLNVDNSSLSLSFPDDVGRPDVSVTNVARLNVRAGNGGSIVINARNLDISGGYCQLNLRR